MTEMRNITINGYGGEGPGHVSITLGSTTYEQQWDRSSYAGAFTSTAGPNDGLIRPRPNPGEPDPLNDNRPGIGPSVSITYAVPTANYQAAQDYIDSNLGINNYGLFTQNCVDFVDNVLLAAGLSTDDWRHEMHRLGGIPGVYPIEALIILPPPRPDLSIWEAEGLPTFPDNPMTPRGWWVGSPLVIDMDGDGVETIARANSNAFFDLNLDGLSERVGWVGVDDALLAHDINRNGRIDQSRSNSLIEVLERVRSSTRLTITAQ